MNLLTSERRDRHICRRMIKAAMLVAGGRLLLRLMSLISLMALARLLSPADYGIAALAITVLGLVQVVSEIHIAQGTDVLMSAAIHSRRT